MFQLFSLFFTVFHCSLRRRRQVNRLGQEEYHSETETEQSELDLAPEVQDLIVQESEMYHEKMEECEELKEEVGTYYY